jgi:hypothetical protein
VSFEAELPAVDEFAARIAKCLESWQHLVAERDGLEGYCNAFAGITLPSAASVGLHTAVDSNRSACSGASAGGSTGGMTWLGCGGSCGTGRDKGERA